MANRGGQANEAGSTYRGGVATYVAILGLVGRPVLALELDLDQYPTRIEFESEDPLDDLFVTNSDGTRAYFQCKRRCGRNEHLRNALKQIVRHCQDNGYDDRLVIASAEFAGDVRELPDALQKRRTGGTYSAGERTAIRAIEEELKNLTKLPLARLLDVLHAWRIDAHDASAPGYESAAAWISTVLNTNAQVESAIGHIKNYLHNLAGSASACSTTDIWRQLTNGGIEIVANANGTPAERITARHAKIESYRETLATNLNSIELPIACDVQTLHIDGLSTRIRGRIDDPHAEKSRRSDELMKITRRLKRFVLYGGPGAGKSTAVEQIAASFAHDREAPLPVIVRLRKVAKHVEYQSDVTIDRLLSCADHLTDDHDLASLVKQLAEEGALLLILDGIDECRVAIRSVLGGLKKLLDGAIGENGVVLTTRPSVLGQVQQLELPTVELAAPESPRKIPTTMLETLSIKRPHEQRNQWLRRKKSLLNSVFDQSEELSQLPLLSMTIAILIATDEATTSSPPTEILERAVRSGIEQWERQRSDGNLIDYDNGLLTPRQLFDSFVTIGYALARSGPLPSKEVTASVSQMLERSFSLREREAEEVAAQAVRFWDARMSIFVRGESDCVEPRSRQFVELADALWLTDVDAEAKRTWISEAIVDESMVDTTYLALGRDPCLAELILADPTQPERALAWVTQFGANNDLATETVESCLTDLANHALEVSRKDDYSTASWPELDPDESQTLRDGPRWPYVLAAARLHCQSANRRQRDAIIAQSEESDELAVATAFAAVTDALVDGRPLSNDELAQLQATLALPIPPRPKSETKGGRRRPVFHIISGEPLLSGRVALAGAAVEFAAQFTPETAKLAENYADQASLRSGLSERIRQLLESAGFEVTPRTFSFRLPEYVLNAPDGKSWAAHEMEALVLVAPEPQELAAHEMWWATETLDLIQLMDLGSASQSTLAVQAHTESGTEFARLAQLFCQAADIHPGNVRATVEYANERGAEEGLKALMHVGFIKKPSAQQPRMDPNRLSLDAISGDIVQLFSSTNEFIPQSLCELVWEAKSQSVSDELLDSISADQVPHPFWACAAASELSDDQHEVWEHLLALDRTEFDHAVAWIAKSSDVEAAMAVTQRLRTHPDLTLRIISGAPDNTDADASHWTCKRCFGVNNLDDEDCSHCKTGIRPKRKVHGE